MNWQYRTILFEFQKDGLLGDRYIDDEEMERVLNEQGEQGWELVSVTTVQEGLLSFFKRVLLPVRGKPSPPPAAEDREEAAEQPVRPPVRTPKQAQEAPAVPERSAKRSVPSPPPARDAGDIEIR